MEEEINKDWFDKFRKRYKIPLLITLLLMGILIFYLIAKWIGVIVFLIYALIRAPSFLKEKKPTFFDKWWQQSYIREIYVVRVGQRIVISLIPLLGVFVSIFVLFWSIIGVYQTYMYPTQPFEKLIKYEGTIKDYSYHRKSSDTLTLQLNNGNIKIFNALMYMKNINSKDWIEKKASIWIEEKAKNLLFENYETIVWIEFDGKNIDRNAFEKQYQSRLELENRQFENLIKSLKWLIGFLVLLWLINIKPIENNIKHSELKKAIVSILGIVLLFISIFVFLALGTH